MPSISINANLIASVAAEVIRRGKNVRLLVRGTCMIPTLASGDRVVMAPTTPENIRVGDVVLVNDRRFIHRVVRIDRDAGLIVTKADNFREEDPPVRIEAVIGTVVDIERPLSIRVRRVLSQVRAAVRKRLEI
jgi:signal peptidase I